MITKIGQQFYKEAFWGEIGKALTKAPAVLKTIKDKVTPVVEGIASKVKGYLGKESAAAAKAKDAYKQALDKAYGPIKLTDAQKLQMAETKGDVLANVGKQTLYGTALTGGLHFFGEGDYA